MTDKINTLISEIHEERKARGAWDSIKWLQGKNADNAVVANKLDEITWSLCDAQRARSEGKKADARHLWIDDTVTWFSDCLPCRYIDTYEHHLAKAL